MIDQLYCPTFTYHAAKKDLIKVMLRISFHYHHKQLEKVSHTGICFR